MSSNNYELNQMFDKFRYKYNDPSALRKLTSGTHVTISHGPVSISKQLFADNNPNKDAYRSCRNCGKHVNFHRDGWCPV